MYREGPYRYYQPEYKVPVAGETLPDGLFSFHAFRSYDEAVIWLRNHDYNPDDFDIKEYHDNDIEDVVLLDENGYVIDRIEDMDEYYVADEVVERVTQRYGGELSLQEQYRRKEGESVNDHQDRVYGDAMEFISDVFVDMEKDGEYNFQSYVGNPDEEWYDEIREIAVQDLMEIMAPEAFDEE